MSCGSRPVGAGTLAGAGSLGTEMLTSLWQVDALSALLFVPSKETPHGRALPAVGGHAGRRGAELPRLRSRAVACLAPARPRLAYSEEAAQISEEGQKVLGSEHPECLKPVPALRQPSAEDGVGLTRLPSLSGPRAAAALVPPGLGLGGGSRASCVRLSPGAPEGLTPAARRLQMFDG